MTKEEERTLRELFISRQAEVERELAVARADAKSMSMTLYSLRGDLDSRNHRVERLESVFSWLEMEIQRSVAREDALPRGGSDGKA